MKRLALAIVAFVFLTSWVHGAEEYSCYIGESPKARQGRTVLDDKNQVFSFPPNARGFEIDADLKEAKCGTVRVYYSKHPCAPIGREAPEGFVPEDFIVVEQLNCDRTSGRAWKKQVVRSKQKKYPRRKNNKETEMVVLQSGFTCTYELWRQHHKITKDFYLWCETDAKDPHDGHFADEDRNHPDNCPDEVIDAVKPPVALNPPLNFPIGASSGSKFAH